MLRGLYRREGSARRRPSSSSQPPDTTPTSLVAPGAIVALGGERLIDVSVTAGARTVTTTEAVALADATLVAVTVQLAAASEAVETRPGTPSRSRWGR